MAATPSEAPTDDTYCGQVDMGSATPATPHPPAAEGGGGGVAPPPLGVDFDGTVWQFRDMESAWRAGIEAEALAGIGACAVLHGTALCNMLLRSVETAELLAREQLEGAAGLLCDHHIRAAGIVADEAEKGEELRTVAFPVLSDITESAGVAARRRRRRERKLEKLRQLHMQECYKMEFERDQERVQKQTDWDDFCDLLHRRHAQRVHDGNVQRIEERYAEIAEMEVALGRPPRGAAPPRAPLHAALLAAQRRDMLDAGRHDAPPAVRFCDAFLERPLAHGSPRVSPRRPSPPRRPAPAALPDAAFPFPDAAALGARRR